MSIDLINLVTIFGLIATAAAFLFWFARLFARFEKLEKQAGHRKGDAEAMLRALLACLDGLRQQGVNGLVTKAQDELREYIIKSR